MPKNIIIFIEYINIISNFIRKIKKNHKKTDKNGHLIVDTIYNEYKRAVTI